MAVVNSDSVFGGGVMLGGRGQTVPGAVARLFLSARDLGKMP